MDDAELKRRLWEGFADLQTLLGGRARQGRVLKRPGLVASVVPSAPESPALNAAIALEPEAALQALPELEVTYGDAGVRRWAVWIDGAAKAVTNQFKAQGLAVASASPGMGAAIEDLQQPLDLQHAPHRPNASLATVGRVNDLAYGNIDARLERTLDTLEEGMLRAYKADLHGVPAAVALALHHDGDCGVSFVATLPQARRHGLATQVMRAALADAQQQHLTTVTLQATELGERLYQRLGLRRLGPMELWEHRR
jgi:ribosomal protein S18 acetylase RimI-like enzyme